MVTSRRSVLLLGPSGVMIVEGRPHETMADHLREALEVSHPHIEWRCSPGLLYVSPGMTRRAVKLTEEANPDAVALLLGAPAFADDFVVNAVRRRWPAAYPAAVRLSRLLKSGAGGGSEGGAGLRGELFRLPRRLAVGVIGAEPDIDVTTAVGCATETIDALLRFEDVPLACRLSFPVPFFRSNLATYESRTESFNFAVRAHCERRAVPVYDLQSAMAAAGTRPTSIADGVHPDRRTQTFDMSLMAQRVATALRLGREGSV